MQLIKSFIKNNWLKVLIILLPIMDIGSYFLIDSKFGNIITVIRLLIMPILYIYSFLKNNNKKGQIIFSIIIFSYFCLHMISCFYSGYLNIVEDISNLLRIVYTPILVYSFAVIFKNDDFFENKVEKGVLIAYLITIGSITLALAIGSANYTYGSDLSLGVIGWFYSKNSQSIILGILAFITGVYSLKNKWYYLLSTTIFVALYFNATKTAYLMLLSFLVFCLFYSLLEYKNVKKGIFTLLLLTIAFCLYKDSPTYRNSQKYNQFQSVSNEVIEDDNISINENPSHNESENPNENSSTSINNKYREYENLYRKYQLGVIIDNFGIEKVLEKYDYTQDAFILSNTRTKKKVYANLIYESESKMSHLFGFEFTKINEVSDKEGNIETLDLESDVIALVYYLGYIGVALYFGYILYIIIKVIIATIRNPKYILKSEYMMWPFLIVILVVGSEFSGALLRRPSANIYLALILAIALTKFSSKNKKIKQKSN